MTFLKGIYHWATDLLAVFVIWVVDVVGKLGYAGIIIMMALESSFVPFPSEVVIPPAGYLTVHGDMNIILVILCGILGSIAGASINYYIGARFGRAFLQKYGKYMFLTEERLVYIDKYFAQHGEITTLIGRLIPVVRQYISFPAGVARMSFIKFAGYTALGASVWVIILAVLGRVVGNNIELVKEHLHTILLILVPFMIVLVAVYIVVKKKRHTKEEIS